MIRHILLFVSLSVLLFGQNIEEQIYANILRALFPEKKIIRIYKDDPIAFPNFHSLLFLEVEHPQEADILLIAHEKSLAHLPPKPIFTNSYYLLKKYPQRIIGGFFWHKGRPNILLLTNTLKHYNLILPKELEEFSDEET